MKEKTWTQEWIRKNDVKDLIACLHKHISEDMCYEAAYTVIMHINGKTNTRIDAIEIYRCWYMNENILMTMSNEINIDNYII